MQTKEEKSISLLESLFIHGILDDDAYKDAGYSSDSKSEYARVVVAVGRLRKQLLLDGKKLIRVGAGSEIDGLLPVYKIE